jgi:hypothetical protein
METSLRFDSQTKHLKLFAKEKFSNDDNYVLTVRDQPSSTTGSPPNCLPPTSFPSPAPSPLVIHSIIFHFRVMVWVLSLFARENLVVRGRARHPVRSSPRRVQRF